MGLGDDPVTEEYFRARFGTANKPRLMHPPKSAEELVKEIQEMAASNISTSDFLDNWLPAKVNEIRYEALLHAAAIASKCADDCYVGHNPIREGVQRGLRDAAIAILDAAGKLKKP